MQKIIITLLCIAMFGCSVNTVQLSSEYNHKFKRSNKAKQLSNIAECSFHLADFKDGRESKSLGVVALTIVENDVNKWALSALEKYNIKENNANTLPHVKVTLVKAYIHSLMSSMAANVVFKIEYKSSAKEQKTNYVRGHEVDVNWNSGESEILSTLNKAMGKAISKARDDLGKNYCT